MGNSVVKNWVDTCGGDLIIDETEKRIAQQTISDRWEERDPSRPWLALQISDTPTERSHGLRRNPFQAGDQLAVVQIKQTVPGWETMLWRQERAAMQQSNPIWPGPEESRFKRKQRFWAAKVIGPDGKGGVKDYWCMLQVAAARQDRDTENVNDLLQDVKDIASYAHRFNLNTARAASEDVYDVPCVLVAGPAACQVLDSSMPEVAETGDVIALTYFPCAHVTKFIFEGSEDFLELPHAFFHFVFFTSGGKEMVGDLQGVQDDKDIVLLDPVMIKTPSMGVSDLVSLVTDSGTSQTPMEKRFNLWHPRCGQMCRSFDPQRKASHVKRACGVALPTCGVDR
eukprot:TRINITY_DN52193_c0_g1_i1.p1 TRINITY_DN52193_c0_g1~~TRINITY_DN52193_c0_g1_i1.p1  ORF type:complete len:340 (-),score=72.87 TRINITY_DN52193_c0_g1_i1:6-1025(-)